MHPALGALLLGATCIALSPIFVRLSEAGPTASAFWRVALAVPALWALYFLKGKPKTRRYSGKWPLLLAAGFAFAGDLGFWHASILLTSVANSTLLANLASIFVTLAAWIFLRQRPSGQFLAGLAAALASGEPMLPQSAYGWWVLIGLALISHASGQGLIAYALAHLPAAFSSVSLLFQPVMAALFAWVLLAEPLVALQMVGGVVVLVGIYLARRGSDA